MKAFLAHRGWVIGLLVAHWGLAVASVRHKSATFDEPGHLIAGLSNWRTGDFRLLPEHPPLPHLWAALPVALSDYREPAWDGPDWWTSQVWRLGPQLLYDLGNDADALLWRARAVSALFSVALGYLVWRWSRRLFGPAGGILSLVLYAFSPTMLAHAPLVTTDAAVSLFFLATVTALWRVLESTTWTTTVLSSLAFAALLLSKVSGVLILPMAGVLVLIRLLLGPPTGKRQWIAWIGAAVLHAVVAFVLIWAFHGFRFAAMRDAQAGRDRLFTPAALPPGLEPWDYELEGLGLQGRGIGWARDHRLLPEAYLFGFASTVKHAGFRAAFFNGETGIHGWRSFFPYAFLVKTPLPFMAVLILAVAVRPPRGPAESARGPGIRSAFYRTAPLWTLLAVYGFTAIQSNLNIGHRHILPLYPALFILAGRAGLWLTAPRRWTRAFPLGLAGASVAVSLWNFPHYLTYFNAIAGGPDQGYKHLVDSSLDWGQDLPGLKRWLAKRDPARGPVYLSYFGTAQPSYYGIDAAMLPSYLPWDAPRPADLAPGTYCISATTLQQLGLLPECRWTRALEAAYRAHQANGDFVTSPSSPTPASPWLRKLRFARLCAALRRRKPDAHVGHSILIYEVGAAELARALDGDPPELHSDEPENLLRLADQAFESGAALATTVLYTRVLDTAPAPAASLARCYGNLAAALTALGRGGEAAEALRRGLRFHPRDAALNNNLAWLLATHPSEDVRNGEEALRHARIAAELLGPRDPNALDTLAAALAEVGQFDEASDHADQAWRLADKQGNHDAAMQIKARLARYRQSLPFRE